MRRAITREGDCAEKQYRRRSHERPLRRGGECGHEKNLHPDMLRPV